MLVGKVAVRMILPCCTATPVTMGLPETGLARRKFPVEKRGGVEDAGWQAEVPVGLTPKDVPVVRHLLPKPTQIPRKQEGYLEQWTGEAEAQSLPH